MDYSPADFATMTGNTENCMGGNWIVWILLFAAFGGNGLGLGGNRGNAATTDEVAAGFNFSGINNKLNEIVAGQANINQNLSNAICQLGYQGAQHTYELGSKIDNCCCTTQRSVDSVKFDMANYAAAINANTVASNQKVLDKLCAMELANKDATIAAQGQRITQLEIDARFCGIPRINTNAWGVYPYPSCNPCGCGTVQTM